MDGGGISKVDDISAEEFAAMTDEPAEPRRARLRVAGSTADDRSRDAATAQAEDDAATDAVDEQRFATVGESFQLLLGKARDARASRRDRASGED